MKLLVLVPTAGPPPPPEALPMARAALALQRQGLDVIFSDDVSERGMSRGLRPRPGGWEDTGTVELSGLYDRFPSQARPDEFAAALRGLGERPCVNPPGFTLLCRDKWASQRHLASGGVAMPEAVGEREAFRDALQRWGEAFLKPRDGAFGRGVHRVRAQAPEELEQLLAASDAPLVLQQAVPRPVVRGEAVSGLALRILVQRAEDGWTTCPAVARWSGDDPVANVARGARVAPAADLFPKATMARCSSLARATAARLSTADGAREMAEVGVDIVLTPSLEPLVIEVNGKPRGHLAALAAQWPRRFAQIHALACMRPLKWLAELAAR